MADADIFKVSILGKDSIHCGFHLISYIVRTVLDTLPSSTYVLVTDNNVAKFYLEAFQGEFDNAFVAAVDPNASAARPRFLSHVIPPGETSKSREGKAAIEDFMLRKICTRDTVVLALGGGVIGDLVGFVAATFMRGVRFVQIPTTLLAMVDSSVGGKTAIDTPLGKNLIGAFWQPEFVFIDAAFLETLPAREFSNGMAEVVKTAAIWNESEFNSLESNSAEIFKAIQSRSENYVGQTKNTRSRAQELLLSVIVGSISVKAHIVTVDERETGLRGLVNFGHSIGHAIEAVLTPTILHGECVSLGMILEAELSRQMGILGQVAVGRLSRCLKSYNLPILLSDSRISSVPAAKQLTVDRLLDIMRVDKKNSGAQKKVVILSKIGATYEQKASNVPDSLISKTLSGGAKVISGRPKHDPLKISTPGSKSISNRALVLAALGTGPCRLKNLLHSDDTQVMMVSLQDLKGANFSWENDGETLVVEGGGGSLSVPPSGKELYLGNAGTAARFLATVCTLVNRSSTDDATTTVITGNSRMKQRPIGPLVTALRENGSQIQFLESEGCLPLAITPQGLRGGAIQLAASVSSQYVSSILLSAPYAAEPVSLELTGGQVISQPYIDMTIAMMKEFGVEVTRRIDDSGKLLDVYDIPNATYSNPKVYNIESDASSATYPLAIAAISGTTCMIENIGSSSLQGDARFAKDVLEKMGCEVEQSATETTVRGPPLGSLKPIDVDMEPMTDAFLTATVLAAVAIGKTRIVGIANQRVKECNRIQAMMDQLAKFGVQTIELDDGLEIIGKPIEELNQAVSVHCYDDHRVAMAFSVLSTVVKDTIIEEKRCVEKTWPNWWDDLENKIGLQVEGVDISGLSASSNSYYSRHVHDTSSSLLLIGMRGSGKTTVGKMAAILLQRAYIDADDYFEQKHQTELRKFVQDKGWPAFRDAETAVLKELFTLKSTDHVISLGGGIVETPEARQLLKDYASGKGPVIHLIRPLEDIFRYLNADGSRPAYGEPIEDVFRRRVPWFQDCSSHDFYNQFEGSSGDSVRNEMHRFFKHVTGYKPNLAANVAPGRRSYFLSLTYPDLTPALSLMNVLAEGVDALEFRADLLQLPRDKDGQVMPLIPTSSFIVEQLHALRRVSSLPVVFTVRTSSQGGNFPDTAQKEAFHLLDLALRLGVEYVDVELTLEEHYIQQLVSRKGSSKIIASWHDWSGSMKWEEPLVREKHAVAEQFGDVIKIVGRATNVEDNFLLHRFVSQIASSSSSSRKPIIAINLGQEGQMSRILNSTLSPVTHPLLPIKAAPGQLSFKQIQQGLHLLGLLPAQRFFLFGNPIAHSMSPKIHNTGFEALGLPHRYELLQTVDVGQEIKAVVRSADFGGASVTVPHKLAIIPLLDELSEGAELIGAVNTIIPRTSADGTSRKLVGDNTDWLGIREAIRPHVSSIESALVIGAGGTARAAIYALQSLDAKVIYLYNRTTANARALAVAFSNARVKVLEAIDEWKDSAVESCSLPPSVIVSTVPASAMTPSNGFFPLSKKLFEYNDGPAVVVDMAYKPAETPLMTCAKEVGRNWTIVPGVEVLLLQAYHQFEAWTGRRCPKHVVAPAVLEAYHHES